MQQTQNILVDLKIIVHQKAGKYLFLTEDLYGLTIQDLLGGIRSTCTYAGAMKLKQLSKCTTFVRCTQQFNAVYASNN